MSKNKRKKALTKKNHLGGGIWNQMNLNNQRQFTFYTGKQGAENLDRAFKNLFFHTHVRELQNHLLDSIFNWDNPKIEKRTFELLKRLKEYDIW